MTERYKQNKIGKGEKALIALGALALSSVFCGELLEKSGVVFWGSDNSSRQGLGVYKSGNFDIYLLSKDDVLSSRFTIGDGGLYIIAGKREDLDGSNGDSAFFWLPEDQNLSCQGGEIYYDNHIQLPFVTCGLLIDNQP